MSEEFRDLMWDKAVFLRLSLKSREGVDDATAAVRIAEDWHLWSEKCSDKRALGMGIDLMLAYCDGKSPLGIGHLRHNLSVLYDYLRQPVVEVTPEAPEPPVSEPSSLGIFEEPAVTEASTTRNLSGAGSPEPVPERAPTTPKMLNRDRMTGAKTPA